MHQNYYLACLPSFFTCRTLSEMQYACVKSATQCWNKTWTSQCPKLFSCCIFFKHPYVHRCFFFSFFHSHFMQTIVKSGAAVYCLFVFMRQISNKTQLVRVDFVILEMSTWYMSSVTPGFALQRGIACNACVFDILRNCCKTSKIVFFAPKIPESSGFLRS